MSKAEILSDQELKLLTSPFQPAGYFRDRARELAASACICMIIEPGDRMAGALAKALGKQKLVDLLLHGFQKKSVIAALEEAEELDSCKAKFGNLEGTLSDSRQRWLPRFSKSRLEHLFTQSALLKLELVIAEDDEWPTGLDDLQDSAPAMLFVQGKLSALSQMGQAVSIVGSRAASSYGLQVTSKLVGELATVDRATVSGGALGIDAQVHKSSIEYGVSTIAVMAGGMDRRYPNTNLKLFNQILSHGVLMSELPPGVAPTRWRFLQRNRLIAALTPITVVIEAGIRSGSIRTANNALELDRELYAVPGSVLSGTSLGTNGLIADNKALALFDLKQFATGVVNASGQQMESDIAKRAQDAIREGHFPTRSEVAKTAGLTALECEIALNELTAQDKVIESLSATGEVHYALKYAF